MNQPVDPNEDTTTAGLGERRRRREAERARARAAGRAEERPLTRRERRARDEALASGALTYGPDGLVPTSEFERIEAESLSAASAAEPASAASAASATDPPPRSRRARREAERAATAASAVSALSAPSATEPPAQPKTDRTEEPVRRREPDGPTAGSDPGQTAAQREPEEPAAGSVPEEAAADRASEEAEERREPQEPAAGRTSEDQETRSEPEQREGSPAMPSAPSPDGGPATALMVPVSRKSLRDKRAAAPAPPTMDARPAERTSTGRRPVVRPPASVRARRGVDGSGELTAIQRAVREANTAAEGIAVGEQGESSSPTSWHSAVDIPAVSYEVSQQTVRPGATAASAPTARSDSDTVSAPSGDSGPPAVSAPSGDSGPPAVSAPSGDSGPPAVSAPTAGSGSSAASAPTTDSGPTAVSAPSADSGPAAASAPTPSRAPEVTSPQEPHSPSSAPSVASADTEDDDGAFDMTPRWESLQRAAALRARADAEPAARPTPPLRTSAMRSAEVGEPPVQPVGPAEEEAPEDELHEAEARKTPGWLFALQMLVLVLVIAILGALVYLFATGDLFGDDDAAVLGLSGSVLWSTGR
ncbi:hypothetical protein [Pseudactinotalea sp. Z1732]|uniref:hypothetical protein n=1 Tax=Micrococcales TaxID=85006 RepID=UPI003C7BDB67